jgi:hypothetical protein
MFLRDKTEAFWTGLVSGLIICIAVVLWISINMFSSQKELSKLLSYATIESVSHSSEGLTLHITRGKDITVRVRDWATKEP